MNVPRLPPGTIVAGKYTIQSELGRGPTSSTYAAIAAPGREIVLRLIAPEAVDESRASAVRALNVAAASVPEHLLARTIDEGRDDASGALFLATFRSVHPSLAELVEVCPFEKQEALAVVAGLINACGPLHAQGIAHLGLHPKNIFVGPAPERVVQLGDLFAYRLRPATPPWAAPEQLDGRDVSIAADTFAIALLAFFALTGKPLVETREEILSPPAASARAAAGGVELPKAVDAVFARALATAPRDRYASVDELHEALADAFGIPKPAPSIPPESVPRFFPSSSPHDAAAEAAAESFAGVPAAIAAGGAPPPAFAPEPAAAPPAAAPAPEFFASQAPAPPPAPPPAPLQVSDAAPRRFPWLALVAGIGSFGVLVATVIVVLRVRAGEATTTMGEAPSAVVIEPAPAPATSAAPEQPEEPREPEPPASAAPLVPSASASPSSSPSPSPSPLATAAEETAPTLRLRPNEGELAVECEPKCGLVMLDGKRMKTGPVAVRAGKHGVGASRPGYSGQWKLVAVEPGKRAVVRFVLLPK